jgi:acetoin utilization deacetylase AcuC-like enzyme
LRKFKPELIIIPSGFDAGAWDPLGRQMMTSTGYRSLAKKMMAIADEVCDGRLVLCHEGGYNAPTVPFYGLAVMETLSGLDMGVADPFAGLLDGLGGQALQPHQDALIEQAKLLLKNIR